LEQAGRDRETMMREKNKYGASLRMAVPREFLRQLSENPATLIKLIESIVKVKFTAPIRCLTGPDINAQ
jgi:hypothetical protein